MSCMRSKDRRKLGQSEFQICFTWASPFLNVSLPERNDRILSGIVFFCRLCPIMMRCWAKCDSKGTAKVSEIETKKVRDEPPQRISIESKRTNKRSIKMKRGGEWTPILLHLSLSLSLCVCVINWAGTSGHRSLSGKNLMELRTQVRKRCNCKKSFF